MSRIPKLYAIGDRGVFDSDDAWLDALATAAPLLAQHPHTAMQIRVKVGTPHQRIDRVRRARARINQAMEDGLTVLLNGTVAHAQEFAFSGAHLPEDLIDDSAMERPNNFLVGASVHSMEAARLGTEAQADFLVYGPVFAPSCKDTTPVGTAPLATIAQAIPTPVLAIGGLTPSRVKSCLDAGAAGVAALSTILQTDHPHQSIQKFMTALGN